MKRSTKGNFCMKAELYSTLKWNKIKYLRRKTLIIVVYETNEHAETGV
jgi:hypothetical protein